MSQLPESEAYSTADELGRPFSLAPGSHKQGYSEGYADALRDEMDPPSDVDQVTIHLYEGFLGTVGEPMVGMPAQEELEAEAVQPKPAPKFALSPQRERHIDPRVQKLTDWHSHGDRSELPSQETPGRVLRWLNLDGLEMDDVDLDESPVSDEAKPYWEQPMSIEKVEILCDEVEDVEVYDSFAEERDWIQEEIDAAYDARERAEAEAAIEREKRYNDEVVAFLAPEDEDEEATPNILEQFPHTQASVEEYKAFLASKGQGEETGVKAYQLADPAFQTQSTLKRAA